MEGITNQILFLVPKITPRVKYISEYILEERLGLQVTLSTEVLEVPRIIEYSEKKEVNKSFYIPSSGMLFEKGLRWKIKVVGEGKNARFPYVENPDNVLDFDVLSGIFYLLSRYEEYQSAKKDEFGRFPFEGTDADRYGFILYPMVDIWVDLLRSRLSQSFPELSIKPNKPAEVAPTIDIDAAFYYRNRPFLNHVISIIGSLIRFQPKAIIKRFATIFGKKPDPYDNHAELIELLKQANFLDIKTFFLMGNIYSSKDRPGVIKEKALVSKCLNLWKSVSQIGIHPSYRSNSHYGLIKSEKTKLEELIGEKITSSRQHFLSLSFPQTYRSLINAGIIEDYSLGYPEVIGFRAGTAYAFPWYDLELEETTSLHVQPCVVMDGTFKNYIKCSPKEAKEKINDLWNIMKNTGGKFTFIWHNSSWTGCDGWDGWEEVFKYTLGLK